MQDTDFFSWLRTMLLRFQRMEAAEEVYHEIELQAQQLEYDYYSLCVRHPVPFTRPKVAFYTNYPESWVSYYQAKNFLAIDPVLNPENFSQGHLMWNDDLFSEAQPLWESARAHGFTPRCHSVFNVAKSGVGLFVLFPLQHARNTHS